MDIDAKKRKIHSNYLHGVKIGNVTPTVPERTMFLDMDNDCMEAICDWLSLADLCSFSLTCTRVYKLTNRYFYRRYKNHRIEIVNELTGPKVKTKEYYAKCFQSNVSNVRVTSIYWNFKPLRLFTFLRTNCCENLRELEFDTINFNGHQQPYGEQIVAQLANLTTISFINCSVYDIYTGFLRFCNHLKHLMIKEEKPIRMNCVWLMHVYSDLESFVYHVTECYNSPPLRKFFKLNSHIKKVSCSGHRIVSVILDTNITLDYLMLRIEHATLFNDAIERLNSLCEQKRVRRFKLDFSWYVIFSPEMTERVASLGTSTTLDGLAFATKELNLKSYHPIIRCRFQHIKSLNLEVAQPLPEIVFHLITFKMPNLHEIHLRPWWSNAFIVNFRICIGTLAAKLKQLKTIAIYQIDPNVISTNAIKEMDIWRKQLSNACPLSIYLPFEIIQNIKFIIPTRSLITVKPLSSLDRDIYSSERRAI